MAVFIVNDAAYRQQGDSTEVRAVTKIIMGPEKIETAHAAFVEDFDASDLALEGWCLVENPNGFRVGMDELRAWVEHASMTAPENLEGRRVKHLTIIE